jgi:hypothetical protein
MRGLTRKHNVAAPTAEMPMFVRGLHEALLGTPSEPLVIPQWTSTRGVKVFTDFSDKASGDWTTYAFLFTTDEEVEKLTLRLAEVRSRLKIQDGRRFEYKSLRDLKRWRAIVDWLEAFDSLVGVVFVLVVSRSVFNAFSTNSLSELTKAVEIIRAEGFGDWSVTADGARLLEHALRAVHLVAYLNAFLTDARTPLHWVSDNDEIFDGNIRRASVLKLFPEVVFKYAGAHIPSRLSTEAELGDAPLRDFLSVPDLAAAAVLEHQRASDMKAEGAIAKTAVLLEWFGKVQNLQKVALRLTPLPEGGVWWNLYRPFFQDAAR